MKKHPFSLMVITLLSVVSFGAITPQALAIRTGTTDSSNIYYGKVLKFYSNVQPTPPSPVDRTGTAVTVGKARCVLTSALNFKQNGVASDYAFYMSYSSGAPSTIANNYVTMCGANCDKGNDLAVVWLKSNSTLNPSYSPVPLATDALLVGSSTLARLAGWGLRNDTASTVGTRRYGDSYADTWNAFNGGAYYNILPAGPNNSLACAGDAGGPLMYNAADTVNQKLYGTATFAEITDSCSTMTHSQFTDVSQATNSSAYAWIQDKITNFCHDSMKQIYRSTNDPLIAGCVQVYDSNDCTAGVNNALVKLGYADSCSDSTHLVQYQPSATCGVSVTPTTSTINCNTYCNSQSPNFYATGACAVDSSKACPVYSTTVYSAKCACTPTTKRKIDLSTGYNLVSPFLDPTDTGTDRVISLTAGATTLVGNSAFSGSINIRNAIFKNAQGTIIAPSKAQVQIWNGSTFDTYNYSGGAWNGNMPLIQPGHAFFIKVMTSGTMTFTGIGGSLASDSYNLTTATVNDGTTTVSVTDAISNGDLEVLSWNGVGYTTYTGSETVYPWKGYYMKAGKPLTLIFN